MLLLQPSPFATFFRTFIEMSILAIAAETFEITCKNTLVTDMLTKRVFVAIFLLLTFLDYCVLSLLATSAHLTKVA